MRQRVGGSEPYSMTLNRPFHIGSSLLQEEEGGSGFRGLSEKRERAEEGQRVTKLIANLLLCILHYFVEVGSTHSE